MDVCRGISPYLKSCSLVSLHLNVLKLGKVDNSVMRFHVMDHVIVVSFTYNIAVLKSQGRHDSPFSVTKLAKVRKTLLCMQQNPVTILYSTIP